MIFITVQSEVMQSVRQFQKDIEAERFLKRVKKLHDLCRHQRLGYFPKYIDSPLSSTYIKLNAYSKRYKFARLRETFALDMRVCIPLKINIQNTEAAQLNFHHQLK